jgi:hypothetical protein
LPERRKVGEHVSRVHLEEIHRLGQAAESPGTNAPQADSRLRMIALAGLRFVRLGAPSPSVLRLARRSHELGAHCACAPTRRGQGDPAAQMGLHQSSPLPKVIFRRGTVLVARKSQRQNLSGSSHSSAEGKFAPIGRIRVFWKATNDHVSPSRTATSVWIESRSGRLRLPAGDRPTGGMDDGHVVAHEGDVSALRDQPAALHPAVEELLVRIGDLAPAFENAAVEPAEPRVLAERGGEGRARALVPAVEDALMERTDLLLITWHVFSLAFRMI